MSSFTRALIIEDTNDGVNWIIRGGGYRYYIGSEDSGKYVSAPDGARTDLASIPSPLHSLVPKLGKGNQIFPIHDLLYRRGFIEVEKPYGVGIVMISRKQADKIMLITHLLRNDIDRCYRTFRPMNRLSAVSKVASDNLPVCRH